MPRRVFLRRAVEAATAGALVPVAGCRRQPASDTPDADAVWQGRLAALEKRIPELMQASHVPGLGIAIVRDAALAWHRSFGVRDRTSNVPVNGDTRFEAASMSKPVFAYVVMKLCEAGVLDLDTPLVNYTAQRWLEGDARLDAITARHVLSHTSGLPDIRSGAEPLSIAFTPGTRWLYSGEGYAYLQAVVTDLLGRIDASECASFEADLQVCATDFDAFMRAHLLEPFGMRASGYVSPDGFARWIARPHDARGEPWPRRAYRGPGAARYGAMGGLVTTATDYARFLIEVMAPKPADEVRLSDASLREMLRPQIDVEEGPDFSVGWGLGWRLARTPEGDLVSHGGDQPGFHCIAEFSPARQSGYVILTNGDAGWELIRTLAPELAHWVHA